MAFYKKIKVPGLDGRRYSYVEVDHNDMRIFDRVCYATYAEEGELIVLLKDETNK
jgi:hypothetical protein